VICVPLPQHPGPGSRLMPPAYPAPPDSHAFAPRAAALLDEVFVDLAHNEVRRGLLALLSGLAELRESATGHEWRRFGDEQWPRHPVSDQLRSPDLRTAAMRVGGPRLGLSALLSLCGESPLFWNAEPARRSVGRGRARAGA
jgi:hypothetical protein